MKGLAAFDILGSEMNSSSSTEGSLGLFCTYRDSPASKLEMKHFIPRRLVNDTKRCLSGINLAVPSIPLTK